MYWHCALIVKATKVGTHTISDLFIYPTQLWKSIFRICHFYTIVNKLVLTVLIHTHHRHRSSLNAYLKCLCGQTVVRICVVGFKTISWCVHIPYWRAAMTPGYMEWPHYVHISVIKYLTSQRKHIYCDGVYKYYST
jgi:hypothetical protein